MTELTSRSTAFVVGALAVAGLSAANGGFFPGSWGWATLAFAWAIALALLGASIQRLGRMELGFRRRRSCALTAWYFASVIWSSTVPSTVFETERALVYPLGVGAALLFVRRRTLPAVSRRHARRHRRARSLRARNAIAPGSSRDVRPVGSVPPCCPGGLLERARNPQRDGRVPRDRAFRARSLCPARALAALSIAILVRDDLLHVQPRLVDRSCNRTPRGCRTRSPATSARQWNSVRRGARGRRGVDRVQ